MGLLPKSASMYTQPHEYCFNLGLYRVCSYNRNTLHQCSSPIIHTVQFHIDLHSTLTPSRLGLKIVNSLNLVTKLQNTPNKQPSSSFCSYVTWQVCQCVWLIDISLTYMQPAEGNVAVQSVCKISSQCKFLQCGSEEREERERKIPLILSVFKGSQIDRVQIASATKPAAFKNRKAACSHQHWHFEEEC